MKTKRVAGVFATLTLAVMWGYSQTAFAQTAGELMQKGIYTQETAGDLDGAISIYRQIVNSGSSPRDIAAQAQYRLAQSLLQKGDLGNAAAEFGNLAKNYADYGRLVSSMANQARGSVAVAGGRGGRGGFGPAQREAQMAADIAKLQASLAAEASAKNQSGTMTPEQATDINKLKANVQRLVEMQRQLQDAAAPGQGLFEAMSFDAGSPVTIKGSVTRIDFMNPAVAIFVDPMDGTGKRYAFAGASPREMTAQGWSRDRVKLGGPIIITGVLANGGQTLSNGTIAASATTITAGDGIKLFDRAAIQK